MPTVSLVLAAIAALLHVYFWVLESLVFRSPRAYRVFGVRQEDVEGLVFSMWNQGFYNLFLALGTLVGVVGTFAGWEPQGPTLVVYGLLFMIGAALVLLVKKPSMLRAALVQGLLPLIALIVAWIW
jgi:putative membrane protein